MELVLFMKVKILKFDHFGRGLAKINGKVIFIPKTLPKEECEISIIKEKKHYMEGKIERIINSSKERSKVLCPYYDVCGGCDFLHTNYEVEKTFKIDKAQELLGKVDNFYETKMLNYRNKVLLHIKNNQIGLYQEGTNRIVPIKNCFLLNPLINKVIYDLSTVDWNKYDISEIIIKTNNEDLLMDVNGDIEETFVNQFSYIESIISNHKIIKGKGYLEEKIDEKVFKITSKAFFQVNKEGLLNINEILQKYLKNRIINKCLDLYSGTSLWGILVSSYCQEVISIEINKEACQNALENVQKNNIHNLRIINGKVENYLDEFKNIDLIIVDPPRSGLDSSTKSYLKELKSQELIYISCDMYTLKRDLDELKDIYDIKEINLVDMFRGTYHVESVCLLSRKTVDK